MLTPDKFPIPPIPSQMLYEYHGWTVIQPGHPDPASFPLTGEIRLRPDCMWHGRSDLYELLYPILH